MTIKSNYAAQGRVLTLPINGNGKAEMKIRKYILFFICCCLFSTIQNEKIESNFANRFAICRIVISEQWNSGMWHYLHHITTTFDLHLI